MFRRIPVVLLICVLAATVACTNKKVNNPLADVNSKQPDKVLFDRAMDAMKHNRFDVSRITLQTLINTYPDSEFIARAKLAVADSWYAEGGTASLAQAEIEYKDFITFFPNMPEAAEAQLKIANIHYQEMEKPDRDYTHAMRAEDEYRQLILQFPDSKLVPEAKQRLMEVQEVLAEREFRVGRFYYLRLAYPAAIARLRTVVDRYPLYSGADESLYLLGQAYESEIDLIRGRKINEAQKAQMITQFTKGAADAYSRILTRYPAMDRAGDAKDRLIALHQPVPKVTRAAMEQNQAEENSRKETSTMGKLLGNFRKHPDVTQAAKVGEPPLVDAQPMSATEVVREATRGFKGGKPVEGTGAASVETINGGAPPPNQEAPRSDTPQNSAVQPVDNSAVPAAQPDPNELKPNVAPDPNELKPNVADDNPQALPPPQQVNELQTGSNASTNGQATTGDGTAGDAATDKDEDVPISSSKHKKKKGLRKIVPF